MTDDKFSYDDAFPGRWLHSPELKGKPWTVRIARAYLEELPNQTRAKGQPKTVSRAVFAFANPKTGVVLEHEYVSSKTNAFICKVAFGEYNTDWVGHLITIASVPCDFGPHGSRVAFIGSPDIEHDISMDTPGGRHMTFRKTTVGQMPDPDADPDPGPEPDADVDPDDAEVDALSTPADTAEDAQEQRSADDVTDSIAHPHSATHAAQRARQAMLGEQEARS